MRFWVRSCAWLVFVICLGSPAFSQHLWWDLSDHPADTCLYGQITVLATHENIYYCGANWHPGEPAGGYCGIQHNSGAERRTIFSIWDTSPTLHPEVTFAEARAHVNRFGGEGEGAHAHTILPWKVGQTFEFFVQKKPGKKSDTTDARYYFFDAEKFVWVHSATITSPNGGQKSVATLGPALASFLENFSGQDRDAPKLATYRLWLGNSIDAMKPLTHADGDGKWGTLHDAYFLAEGDDKRLSDVFSSVENELGRPAFGKKGVALKPISEMPIRREVIDALKIIAGRN